MFSRSNLTSSLPSGEHILPSSKWEEVKTKLSTISVPEGQAPVQFENVLTKEALGILLKDNDIRSALFPFVTDAEPELDQLIQSEAFQQRLKLLNAAVEQDELEFILSNLGIEKGTFFIFILHTFFLSKICFLLYSDLKAFLKAAKEQALSKTDAMDED